jgi:protein-S-isoprenylcysteine O-methyltransferase Ste14
MSAQLAVNILWPVWYATWIGAVIFSAKTKTQMRSDVDGMHRILAGLSIPLLFWASHPAKPGQWVVALFTQRLWAETQAAQWVLFALVAACFAFCWWARVHLGKLWSGLVTIKEGHRIVDTGPYGLVRHPIYSGVMAAALFTALMRASPASFLGFILLTAGFSITARIEEGFLRQQLGAEAYDGYSRRVGMLLPRFG